MSAKVGPISDTARKLFSGKWGKESGIYVPKKDVPKLDAIPTDCLPLEYVLGCRGVPRGRLIELFGPEASGKCVSVETAVPVQGEGLIPIGELIKRANWRDADRGVPDRAAILECEVGVSDGYADAVGAYYAGEQDLYRMQTEEGHDLEAIRDHRVLTLGPAGTLRWVQTQHLRPEMKAVIAYGHEAGGPTAFAQEKRVELSSGERFRLDLPVPVALLGALATAEPRQGELWLPTITPGQRQRIQKWASQQGLFDLIGAPKDFASFCGLVKVLPGAPSELAAWARTTEASNFFQRCPVSLQAAWCAGVTLTAGRWCGESFECEFSSEEVARCLRALLENLSIRCVFFQTLSTFGEVRWKVSLRSRKDLEIAATRLWYGQRLPATWKGQTVSVCEATDPLLKLTLIEANQILAKVRAAGGGVALLDPEDISRENLSEAATRLASHARTARARQVYQTLDLFSRPGVGTDTVVESRACGRGEAVDVSVPIGRNYAAGNVVSHNSTLALHICRKEVELQREGKASFQLKPKSSRSGAKAKDTGMLGRRMCLYFDYERGMDWDYAGQMGLSDENMEFLILKPDTFEQGDAILYDLWQEAMSNDENATPSIVVFDSVPAMTPARMYTRDPEADPEVGLLARRLGEAMTRWVKFCADLGTTIIFINQVRTKIEKNLGRGPGGKKGFKPQGIRAGYGTPDEITTPGGKALLHFASVRIGMFPSSIMKESVFNPLVGDDTDIPFASLVRLKGVKNKCGNPHREGLLYIEFGRGVDNYRTCSEIGRKTGVIDVSGSWLSVDLPGIGEIRAQGEARFLDKLKATPGALDALTKKLQWDQAEVLAKQVTGLVREDVATGDIMDIDRNIDPALIEEAAKNTDIWEQARILGVFRKAGALLVYHREDGEPSRRQKAVTLWRDLSPEEQHDVWGQVAEILGAERVAVIPSEAEEVAKA